ncbi:MAG: DNA-binding response regulator [Fibrobacterota bacterium]
MIHTAVYDPRQSLITTGLTTVFQDTTDITVCGVWHDEKTLFARIKNETIHILFMVVAEFSSSFETIIKKLRSDFPKIHILVVTLTMSREKVFHAIQTGATGLVSADAQPRELKEAVYTLRHGHEYFSKSISDILVNSYLSSLRDQTPESVQHIEKLSKREREVLSLWGEGLTNAEIADQLFVSVRTVESHKNHIMQKLNFRTTVELMRFAIKNNIIQL